MRLTLKDKYWILIAILFPGFLLGGETIDLPQLIYPKNIVVKQEQDRLLITDYPDLYLYRLSDLKLIKKMGGFGNGPGEFVIDQEDMSQNIRGLSSYIDEGLIFVNCQGRLSVFSLDGDFIKVIPTKSYGGGYSFRPFGKQFLAMGTIMEGRLLYTAVKIFDQNLKEIKEIKRAPSWLRNISNFEEGYDFFDRANGTLSFTCDKKRIYVSENSSLDIDIKIFSTKGKVEKSINFQPKRVPIPEEFKDEIEDYYKLKFKRGLKINLKNTHIKDFFPGMRKFFVDNDVITIVTYYRQGLKNEVLQLDLNGNLLRQLMLPMGQVNPELLYPCTVDQNVFYQLTEDESNDVWSLRIIDLATFHEN